MSSRTGPRLSSSTSALLPLPPLRSLAADCLRAHLAGTRSTTSTWPTSVRDAHSCPAPPSDPPYSPTELRSSRTTSSRQRTSDRSRRWAQTARRQAAEVEERPSECGELARRLLTDTAQARADPTCHATGREAMMIAMPIPRSCETVSPVGRARLLARRPSR
jgi:hypothetical protein